MSVDIAFVPGLNNTAAVWDAVLPALDAEAGAGVRCHALTSPALDNMEELARNWLERLPERFRLVGFSLGGYIALAMLEIAPQRIDGLALVCTGAGADTPQQLGARETAIAKALSGEYESMIATQAAAAFHPDSLGDAALMERRMTMVKDYGVQRFAAHARAAMMRPDRTRLLSGFRGPVVFIAGSHDKLFPPDSMRALSAETGRGMDIEVIEGAGHLLPMEQPRALAKSLARWAAA